MKRKGILLSLVFIAVMTGVLTANAGPKIVVRRCHVEAVDSDGLEIECRHKRKLTSYYYQARDYKVVVVKNEGPGQVQIVPAKKRGGGLGERSKLGFMIPEDDLEKIKKFMTVVDLR